MTYSDEIWIACHDEDEQNAKLASQIWEENALDVEENYADSLLAYLGRCIMSSDTYAMQLQGLIFTIRFYSPRY